MKRNNGFTQIGFVQMGIDFGSGDGFVSQHLLHGPEVGTPLHQMGGKGVPEGVAGGPLGYLGSENGGSEGRLDSRRVDRIPERVPGIVRR